MAPTMRTAFLVVLLLSGCTKSPRERAKETLLGVVKRTFPTARVQVADDVLRVSAVGKYKDVELGVDNLARQCDDARACEEAAARLVAQLTALEGSADPKALRPMFKTNGWLDSVRSDLASHPPPEGGERQTLPSDTFLGDVSVVWMLDGDQGMKLVTSTDLTELKLTQAEAAKVALANLQAANDRPLAVKRISAPEDPLVLALSDKDSLAASRVLLVERWAEVAKQVKGTLVVMMPNRDLVLATGSGEPKGVSTMLALGRDTLSTIDHPLSTQLIEWNSNGWALYRP